MCIEVLEPKSQFDISNKGETVNNNIFGTLDGNLMETKDTRGLGVQKSGQTGKFGKDGNQFHRETLAENSLLDVGGNVAAP